MKKKILLALLVSVLSSVLLSSCGVKKAFSELDKYNYFAAKNNFDKRLKNNQSPAAYGLSLIYSRNDNPFSNIDSAYHFAIMAVETYDKKPRKHSKWEKSLDYTLTKAKNHREKISDLAFTEVVEENTVDGFKFFLTKYPWSKHFLRAEEKRDSLAFLEAKNDGNSESYEEFLNMYAMNKWTMEAVELLQLAQYKETVSKDNVESYLDFIQKYPDNAWVEKAHEEIYELETKGNTIAEFYRFIKAYPSNPFVEDAWQKLYRLSIADYKTESIRSFSKKYPEFPFQDMIERDLHMVGKNLFQFVRGGKYGFMNENSSIVIPAKFDYAENFKDGLAVVSKEGKYGYINKEGSLMIDYQFDEAGDFDQGRAIVAKGDYYGLIDVSGSYVLQPKFEDIGPISEDLMYVESAEGFQYYKLDGSLAFEGIFDEAFSFRNGMAQVRQENKNGFILPNGSFLISVEDGSLRLFKDSLFVHEVRGEANLISLSGGFLFPESFDEIGVLVDNRAIVQKDGKYGYINGKGEVVIPLKFISFPNYLQFAQFKNNHAVSRQGDRYTLIDKDGKKLLPALFSGVGAYGKLIPVTKGSGWGYCDDAARLRVNYQYSYAHEFVNGIAIVDNNGKQGLINLEGKEITNIQYESIKRIENNLFLVKENNQFGILTENGAVLVESKYDRITQMKDDLFQLISNEDISYYDILNDRFISLER